MGSYLAHEPEIYPKAHENPRAFSCIPDPIFLESPSHGSGDGSPPWEDCIIYPYSLSHTYKRKCIHIFSSSHHTLEGPRIHPFK